MKPATSQNLSEAAYARLKRDVFEFRLLPGDRFTENELARELGMSRTPVREALNRLAQEGHLSVAARSGWTVRPLDFELFDQLYDARTVLELAAVRRLCEQESAEALAPLREVWLVPVAARLSDERQVAALDEQFHALLVAATGNMVMAQMHHEVTERIRIIRRLDFTDAARIAATYDEHALLLRSILKRKVDNSCLLLKAHIETSKRAVRKITLHRLFMARTDERGRAAAAARAAQATDAAAPGTGKAGATRARPTRPAGVTV